MRAAWLWCLAALLAACAGAALANQQSLQEQAAILQEFKVGLGCAYSWPWLPRLAVQQVPPALLSNARCNMFCLVFTSAAFYCALCKRLGDMPAGPGQRARDVALERRQPLRRHLGGHRVQ